jgi:hypothetical protein
VAVGINPLSASFNHDATLHLVNALRAERITVEAIPIHGPIGITFGDIGAPIHILIGEKP